MLANGNAMNYGRMIYAPYTNPPICYSVPPCYTNRSLCIEAQHWEPRAVLGQAFILAIRYRLKYAASWELILKLCSIISNYNVKINVSFSLIFGTLSALRFIAQGQERISEPLFYHRIEAQEIAFSLLNWGGWFCDKLGYTYRRNM